MDPAAMLRHMRQAGTSAGAFPASCAAWRDRVHPDDLPAAKAAITAHLAGHSSGFSSEFAAHS